MGTVHSLTATRPGITPAVAVSAYLDTFDKPGRPTRRAGKSAGTRRVYGGILERFAARFADADDLAAVEPGEAAAWFRAEWDSASADRWNNARSALKAAAAWWALQEWIPDAGVFRTIERQATLRPDNSRALDAAYVEQLLTRRNLSIRERTLWRLLFESAARVSEVLRLDVTDLDMANHCAQVVRKGGRGDVIHWQSGTGTLLPRMLKGRRRGPLFLTDRRARVSLPSCDIDPASGRARLGYRRAAELFSDATGGATLHQLRHGRLTQLTEAGASTPIVMAISGHVSERSLLRYARPSVAAVSAYLDDQDPARRR